MDPLCTFFSLKTILCGPFVHKSSLGNLNLYSGLKSGYCLLILRNAIFYILVKTTNNIEYGMDEKLISASRTIKDLGIVFEDNFKFEEHY